VSRGIRSLSAGVADPSSPGAIEAPQDDNPLEDDNLLAEDGEPTAVVTRAAGSAD
jgi:hypothetical protein